MNDIIPLVAMILGPTGAAWVGVKVALNGTKQSVDRIEKKVDNLADCVHTNREAIVRLETRIEQ